MLWRSTQFLFLIHNFLPFNLLPKECHGTRILFLWDIKILRISFSLCLGGWPWRNPLTYLVWWQMLRLCLREYLGLCVEEQMLGMQTTRVKIKGPCLVSPPILIPLYRQRTLRKVWVQGQLSVWKLLKTSGGQHGRVVPLHTPSPVHFLIRSLHKTFPTNQCTGYTESYEHLMKI